MAAYSTGADAYKFLGNLFAFERSLEIVQAGLLVVLVIASSIMALQKASWLRTWRGESSGSQGWVVVWFPIR